MDEDEIKEVLLAGGYSEVSQGEFDDEGWILFTGKKDGRNFLLRCHPDGRLQRFVEDLLQ